jgi:hypothetical protein
MPRQRVSTPPAATANGRRNGTSRFTGGYLQVNCDDRANNLLCALEARAAAQPAWRRAWNYRAVGSRLQWDVTKSFYLGVEALYLQQDTASSATGLVIAVACLAIRHSAIWATAGIRTRNTWVFTVRMHKDVLPIKA